MLCSSCRRQVSRDSSFCSSCGAPIAGNGAPLELVLADATRVPLTGEVVIGRAPGNTLQLADPSVSRRHARIVLGNGAGALIEDAGSSHGTFLDGRRVTEPVPLHDGARIRVGNQELIVERRRDSAEAGRTIVVKAGASLLMPAAGGAAEVTPSATQYGMRPRVRSGYALKRLDADEGKRRWILKDLNDGGYLRLGDADAFLFELLDGERSLVELIGIAEQRFGAQGPARLARLLADLGERGYLAGVTGATKAAPAPQGFWRRLVTPKEKAWTGVGARFDWLYRHGGWVLFTRPALWLIGALALSGIGVFAYLVAFTFGTPFVVASHIGLGGIVFLIGRFLVVAVHETAHGLTMSSYGRRVQKAGFKLIVIFPYAFVDTSEAWFEPRRRRIAISAAGPVSDFTLGAIFGLCCLVSPRHSLIQDIFFQLAFAGYVGAFFNLNPFIERDGYHILVDVLREPGLRRRAKEQFARRLAGQRMTNDSPVLGRYAIWGLVWSFLAGSFAVVFSLRYLPLMKEVVSPDFIVYVVLGTLWVAFFIPVFVVVGKPLVDRLRGVTPAPAGS
jgi:putative peptide zinc metalloprotease protein